MNYRHAFHAGNFADVFKHAVLTLLVERLKAKDTGFAVIDTHAGAGLYDVTSAEAQRTGEFARGYGQLAGRLPAELAAYGAAVMALNPKGAIAVYPGSPALVRHLLRPQDRLVACELHPDDAARLKRNLAGDRRVQCHHRDGYAALKALLPPKERRGLVLIDPPFEAADERRIVARALSLAHGRWPTGTYAIWYPIKAASERDLFHGELASTGIRRLLAAEMLVDPGDRADRLNGCGMVIVNPPYGLDHTLRSVLPVLHRLLAAEGGTAVDWLVPE
ncbi:MAG: 23S rRNA (adenine(2030)-N(6))-methyltransferase RlmJ [Alphaproteobacteria bacterium]|nr:23S rRNA (adenine(2030)-N(6))-methyltransferase RlmJ [Alphaproteobacteria bacterium]